MTAFFIIVAGIGLMWLVLEAAAKSNSPAPSMYYTSGNGWLLVIAGVIGALCVRFLS